MTLSSCHMPHYRKLGMHKHSLSADSPWNVEKWIETTQVFKTSKYLTHFMATPLSQDCSIWEGNLYWLCMNLMSALRSREADSEITGGHRPFSVHFSHMTNQILVWLAIIAAQKHRLLLFLIDLFAMYLIVNTSFCINTRLTTFSTLAVMTITNLATEWPPNIV